MRTNKGAPVALVAYFCFPVRHVYCQPALFVGGNTHLDLTVFHGSKYTGRQIIALLSVDRIDDLADHPRSGFIFQLIFHIDICPFRRDLDLDEAFNAGFNSLYVLLYNSVALGSVFILDCPLHLCHSLFHRNDFHDGEERRLKNGILVVSKAKFFCDLSRVYDIEIDISLCQQFLVRWPKLLVRFLRSPRTVDKQCAARLDLFDDPVIIQEVMVVTGYEISILDIVRASDRAFAEAQV